MLFLHWRCAPDTVASLLPDGLEPDIWDGSAWLSLTPFGVGRGGPPPITGWAPFSDFTEANLRTYVRGPGDVDGVWFVTLEVDNAATALAGRLAVPYRLAHMGVDRSGTTVTYRSARRGDPSVGFSVEVRPGRPMPAPGAFDHWLTGRWRAWVRRAGVLAAVPVRHEPWPLHEVELVDVRTSLLAAHGLADSQGPDHLHWSPGVDAHLGVPRPTGPALRWAGS